MKFGRILAFFVTCLVCIVAWAVTYGPFPIAAAGTRYASTTFAMDSTAEFEGANKTANIYLAKILNTPLKIAKALREDSVRIVYFDGQIAEFRISRWPSTNPLDFSEKLSSANQQTRPRYIAQERDAASCFGDYSSPISVQTGYLGSRVEWDSNGTATIIGTWINTGIFTFFPSGSSGPYPKRCP